MHHAFESWPRESCEKLENLPELLILPQWAVPALPGATRTCWTCGDWASFQANACSRPPPPTTRTRSAMTPGFKQQQQNDNNKDVPLSACRSLCLLPFYCLWRLSLIVCQHWPIAKAVYWAVKERWPFLRMGGLMLSCKTIWNVIHLISWNKTSQPLDIAVVRHCSSYTQLQIKALFVRKNLI